MRIVTLLLFLLLTVSARAQNPGTVAGTVRDRATQEALPGVSVTLDGTSFGTATASPAYRPGPTICGRHLWATTRCCAPTLP